MGAHCRRCSIALLVLLALALIAPATQAAAGGAAFGIRPVRYDPARPATQGYFIYDTSPGQEVRDEVLVRNGGDAAGIVHLYAVDSMTAESSGTVFPDEEAPRRAVGTWIRLAEWDFSLEPGEERIVPFTVTSPADARDGQHVGGIAAANAVVVQGATAGAVRINTRNRAVTAVQVNLPGPSIERVAVTGVATGEQQAQQTIVLGLRNDGTAMVKPIGTLTITDAQGQEVQRLPLQLDTFLPDTAIRYPVAVQRQALGAGQYRAKVALTYGASGVTSYEGEFSITAAQVAQVFPSAAPALAPPPIAATGASAAPTATITTAAARWPLFAGGAVLLVLALSGGVFLGRRGRSANAAK